MKRIKWIWILGAILCVGCGSQAGKEPAQTSTPKSDTNRTAVCGTNCSTGGGNTGGGKKKCNDTGTLI